MMLRIRPHRPKKPIVPAAVAITFIADSRRRFDLSNAAESVKDLLVDAEIFADDSAFIVGDLHLKLGSGAEEREGRSGDHALTKKAADLDFF